MNQVIYRGYFANPTFSIASNGSARISFRMIVPVPVVKNGQIMTDANGVVVTRDSVWRCQAWGDTATALQNVPEGTPIEVVGNNHRFSFTSNKTGERVWMYEVRVFAWKYL